MGRLIARTGNLSQLDRAQFGILSHLDDLGPWIGLLVQGHIRVSLADEAREDLLVVVLTGTSLGATSSSGRWSSHVLLRHLVFYLLFPLGVG